MKRIPPVDEAAYAIWARGFPKREGKLARAKRLPRPNRPYCAFCGLEDRPVRMMWNDRYLYAPMLRLDLWKRVGAATLRGNMCLACMRRRIGRPFTAWDLKKPWWRYQLLPSDGGGYDLPRH